MKRLSISVIALCLAAAVSAKGEESTWILSKGDTLRVTTLCSNAVRVQVLPKGHKAEAASFYKDVTKKNTDKKPKKTKEGKVKPKLFKYDEENDVLSFYTASGALLFSEAEGCRTLKPINDQGTAAWQVAQSFATPKDEYQYGTGQFQDGNLNVKGLTRRLTQVNTQIALPMIISNKGYGILWNNSGMTDFNPAAGSLALEKEGDAGEKVVVNTTGTEGNKREERQYQPFVGTRTIAETAEHSLLFDVG